MRGLIIIIASLIALQSVYADIVYLKKGDVYAGRITVLDASGIEIELSDGQRVSFQLSEVFRATDDDGMLLYDGSLQPVLPQPQPAPEMEVESGMDPMPLEQNPQVEYRRVVRFPLWPLLGGTAILGYFGISQLNKSADTYDEADRLKEEGYEFSETDDRAQKQKNIGQICLVGAVACLVVGLTPRFEKVPLQNAVRLIPTNNGLALCINF